LGRERQERGERDADRAGEGDGRLPPLPAPTPPADGPGPGPGDDRLGVPLDGGAPHGRVHPRVQVAQERALLVQRPHGRLAVPCLEGGVAAQRGRRPGGAGVGERGVELRLEP
jgi:hypothetical protein